MSVSGATTSEREAMLNGSLDKTGLYLGLLTTMPTLNNGTDYTEVATAGSTGYLRVSINASYPGTNDWEAAQTSANGVATQKKGPQGSIKWTFPKPTADWGNVKGWAIFDSGTRGAGTMKHCGLLSSPIDILSTSDAPELDSNHQIICQLGDSDDTF